MPFSCKNFILIKKFNMNLKEKLYLCLPHFLQNCLVTLFNVIAYKKRHGGNYKKYKSEYLKSEKLSYDELYDIQEKKLKSFLEHTYNNSTYYNSLWKDYINDFKSFKINDLKKLPIITKEDVKENIDEICTQKKNTIVSNTGGTTGKSLQVYFSIDNAQERFACLDNFKNRFGWEFGDRTAWFSGRNFLSNRDLKKNRYWKTDFINNIQFYSTFNINKITVPFYIKQLNKYKPKFFSGFPSSILEIAKISINLGLKLNYIPNGIFPTAESTNNYDKTIIESFYNCKMYDQYASSEGAPFITQCKNGHMHIEMLSGVFEVIDENGNKSNKGELIITPFATKATPLVRYKIGDQVELENNPNICCYNKAPIVKNIFGRVSDFIYSKERGKINIINICNSSKYVKGIDKFQIIQNKINEIKVLIVTNEFFSANDEKLFLKELRDRLGYKILIKFEFVEFIPIEKSGKFRIIKNSLNI